MIKGSIKAILDSLGYTIVRKAPPSKDPVLYNWGPYDCGIVPLDDQRLRGRLIRKFATPAGTYFLPDEAKDDIVSAAIRMGEVFEERIMQMARHFVSPGTIVFDVGANYGQFSVMLASMVGVEDRFMPLRQTLTSAPFWKPTLL